MPPTRGRKIKKGGVIVAARGEAIGRGTATGVGRAIASAVGRASPSASVSKHAKKARLLPVLHVRRWEVVRRVRDGGVKWVDVWSEAAKVLKKTPYGGRARAIKYSYDKVQRERRQRPKGQLGR